MTRSGKQRRRTIDRQSLSVQLIVAFVVLVFLTAIAVGLPALWLIRQQLDSRAWAQVDQSRRAAEALYAARQNELAGLATLTAQRPTLSALLAADDRIALSEYLDVLESGAELDLVMICRSGEALVHSSTDFSDDVCGEERRDGYHVSGSVSPAVWLLASHQLADQPELSVVIGEVLDDDFTRLMESQTGLEHILWVDGQPAAGTLEPDEAAGSQPASDFDAGRRRFVLHGNRYYAEAFNLDSQEAAELTAEVALPTLDIISIQQSLTVTFVAGILVVSMVGSLLGVLTARRISRPLASLEESADALRKGDLATPVTVESGVREVASVAEALEDARSALQYSLDELRQEKAWVDHLLEAVVEGIVALDQAGRIAFFSQGAERILGLSQEEVIGRSGDALFQPAETNVPFSQLLPAPGLKQTLAITAPDGRHVTLAITGARLAPPMAGRARVAFVFRDVSDEVVIHRLLGDFLANITHEFRTPLSALAASVELLLDQLPDLNPAELRHLLESHNLGLLGLQTLIDNLLEGASIEAGRFRVYPQQADLGEIIADVVRTMTPLLAKRGQYLAVKMPDGELTVLADARRTAQVLVNLLSNASKYGPDDSQIDLEAIVQQTVVRIAVADRGSGIAAGAQSDLFRRFGYRASGSDEGQVGVGLGLSVVKAIVEAQQGSVGVEERPGGGAIFWFTLPLALIAELEQ